MKLTDICDVQGGSQPPKEEWSFEEQEGYIRMLQIRDFTQSERVTPEYIKISNSSGVEIRLRQLGRRLELDKIHPHKFRRSMATRAIDKGMPIEQVQKILGHSQIDTTMQYAMVNQNNVKTSHQKYMT